MTKLRNLSERPIIFRISSKVPFVHCLHNVIICVVFSGSPNLRPVSPDRRAGLSGSPGLAPLEQLTAGVGSMPPPLARLGAVPSPPALDPAPRGSSAASSVSAPRPRPMPPLLHVQSGRVAPAPRTLPPPRLTPATVASTSRPNNTEGALPPPLQKAPGAAAAETNGPRVGLPRGTGRGNPSVAVVQPMPPAPPPTPPEPSPSIDTDDIVDEEEAKRAFSVFNLRPSHNRGRAAAVNSTPVETPIVIAPASVSTTAIVPTPEEAQIDFSQFQVRPRGPPPRYPTHAAGFGMTPPVGGSTATQPASALQFTCPYCPYEGPSSGALKSHILTHQPNIQWICPYCPGPTRMSKQEVTNHMKTAHPACQLVYIPYGVSV